MAWWVLVFLVSIGTAAAEDPRLALFERYNRASSGDEVKPLVSGTLARQYGVLASKEAFFDAAGRFGEAGITDLVVQWPRVDEPFAGDVTVLEKVAEELDRRPFR